jgi:integrase
MRSAPRRHHRPEATNELEVTYLAYLAAEGMSAETVRQRIYLLRGIGVPPAQATSEDIVAFLNSRELSKHSRAAYLTVLRSVFADLLRIGLVDHDPTVRLKTPRTPRRSPRPISAEQLAALETLPKDSDAYRWSILGAYAGLRVGEVISLTGTALQARSSGLVLHLTGKGDLTADIPAHPKVVEVLKPYEGVEDYLWPMWPQSLNRAWQRAAASVGVTDVTFHQLRHSFATRLTRAGVDLLVIADLCRHASVATTQRYAKVADDAPFQAVVGL